MNPSDRLKKPVKRQRKRIPDTKRQAKGLFVQVLSLLFVLAAIYLLYRFGWPKN